MSSNPRMWNVRRLVRAIIFAWLLAAFSAASISVASAQVDFTLASANGLQPSVVEPGGPASASLELDANGANNPVTLSCVVTSTQTTLNLPTCTVSPGTATPPAQPSLTVNTLLASGAGLYKIAVTATDASGSVTLPLTLNVVPVSADYTVTVNPPPVPSTVAQGYGAKVNIVVTPIGSYSGSVSLFCLSITPVVLSSPVCSFSPSPVPVVGGAAPTAVLTITTFGTSNTTTAKAWKTRVFYALWLAFPGLALVGAGASGKLKRNVLGLLLLLAVGGGVLLMPACNASSTSSPTSPTGQVTPKGSYTFTITGVDQTGASPSNTTTTEATVSLTVD